MNQIHEYNDKFYVIKQDKHEISNLYWKRVWFILKEYNKMNISFKKIIILSRIRNNIDILKCKYEFFN